MKEKSIEILKGIAIIAGYQILPAFMMIPFSIYIKNQTIRYITLYLTILIGLLYIYRKDILKEIKKFKFNYLINTTVYWLIGLTIMITSSTILHNLGIDIATNQQNNINQSGSINNSNIHSLLQNSQVNCLVRDNFVKVTFKKPQKHSTCRS